MTIADVYDALKLKLPFKESLHGMKTLSIS